MTCIYKHVGQVLLKKAFLTFMKIEIHKQLKKHTIKVNYLEKMEKKTWILVNRYILFFNFSQNISRPIWIYRSSFTKQICIFDELSTIIENVQIKKYILRHFLNFYFSLSGVCCTTRTSVFISKIMETMRYNSTIINGLQ